MNQLKLPTLGNFYQEFRDYAFDPFKSQYLEHLHNLNKIIINTGEPLEGNIFYRHHATHLTDELFSKFLDKRRGLALFGIMHDSILEIGFNSGYSALLLLTANPNLKLTCVDICEHRYTVPCYEYLKNAFGDRITLIKSDSTQVFPQLVNHEFSGYIIDGGHGLEIAETDLLNVLAHGRRGSVVCFDDSDFPDLRLILNLYMLSGRIISLADTLGHLPNARQMFFINNKP